MPSILVLLVGMVRDLSDDLLYSWLCVESFDTLLAARAFLVVLGFFKETKCCLQLLLPLYAGQGNVITGRLLDFDRTFVKLETVLDTRDDALDSFDYCVKQWVVVRVKSLAHRSLVRLRVQRQC